MDGAIKVPIKEKKKSLKIWNVINQLLETTMRNEWMNERASADDRQWRRRREVIRNNLQQSNWHLQKLVRSFTNDQLTILKESKNLESK